MIYELSKLPPKLMLGKAGENMATEIGIDVSEWAKAYPSGTYSIVFQRADKESYPVVMANQGNVLVWKPSATDLLAGYGKLEVRMYDGEVIAKSMVIATYVTPSIEMGEIPDPKTPDWVQEIIDAYSSKTKFIEKSDLDGTSIYYGEDGKVHTQGGGTVDAYTKAETDELLEGKADQEEIEEVSAEVSEIKQSLDDTNIDLKKVSNKVYEKRVGTNLYDGDETKLIFNKVVVTWGVGTSTIESLYDKEGWTTYPPFAIDRNVKEYVFLSKGGRPKTVNSCCFYDQNKVLIDHASGNTVQVPENAYYMRFSYKASTIEVASVQPKNYTSNRYFLDKYGEYEENLIQPIDTKIPVICFDFDLVTLDNRYTTLKQYGYTATWQVNSDGVTSAHKTLVRDGHDLSPYAGLTDEELGDENNASKLVELINPILRSMESIGQYNPTMFSCSRHRGGTAVTKALNELGIKYQRCSTYYEGNNLKIPTWSLPNEQIQFVASMARYNTIESIKEYLQNCILIKNPLIMLMSHTMEYDGITEENYFENLVEYVHQLEAEGTVKVMNMREYYEYYFPNEGAKEDRKRIMNAILDLTQK